MRVEPSIGPGSEHLGLIMSRSSHLDLHCQITDSIIAAIEAGATTCTMPWHRTGLSSVLPTNALTHASYQGINILALWVEAQRSGYEHSLWATYRQWSELGAQVRRGEKSSAIIFYKEYEVDPDPANAEDDGLRRVARASRVFNIAQVDGYLPPEIPLLPPIARIARAGAFTAASQADIRHGGDIAYYRRPQPDGSGDFIQMPDENLFQASAECQRTEDYYSVLMHELTHWTGASSRCNRDLGKRFGDAAYAMEELVAELGAAFLCAELGISSVTRAGHAGYVANWLGVLKNDKRAIFAAAAKASQATAYLRGLPGPS